MRAIKHFFYFTFLTFGIVSCAVKKDIFEYHTKIDFPIENLKAGHVCLEKYDSDANDYFKKMLKKIKTNYHYSITVQLYDFLFQSTSSCVCIIGEGSNPNEEFFLLYIEKEKLTLITNNIDVEKQYKLFLSFAERNNLSNQEKENLESKIKDFIWRETFKKHFDMSGTNF